MELHIQYGYGMSPLCKDLIRKWGKGMIILSPRDQDHDKMIEFTKVINDLNGDVVFDPQFYVPQADHARLTNHSFWPSDYDSSLFDRTSINKMLTVLKVNYNDILDTQFFILPGRIISIVNDDWFNHISMLIEEARKIETSKDIYLTLCISKEIMSSENDLHNLLEYLEELDFDGCYLVTEPAGNLYFVQDPIWILNLMDFITGLKIIKKKVILGYSNHQHLLLAVTKIDAIASGSWLNTRSFNANKFIVQESSVARSSTWYYCPQALTEYQIPFLDLAKKFGVLENIRTDKIFQSNTSDVLFSGAQPSSAKFNRRDSFAHYLHCLKLQANDSVKQSYELTRDSSTISFETARMITDELRGKGVIGRDRDFSNVADINISSITAFNTLRGLGLKHSWSSL